MTNGRSIESKCYQCGGTEFVLPDDATEDDWITCDRCGERFMTCGEFKTAVMDVAVEEARKNLGVDDFLKSRKID